MYTYNSKVIKAGRGWTDSNGVKHPSNWMRWTAEEKTAMGLTWVDDPVPFDSRFYWSAGDPKAIADVTEEDGSVTKGLKSVAIEQTKVTAGSLLASTDWYIVREQETGEATPTDVLNYRATVRTASGAIESAIAACTTHEAFIALYAVPVDADGVPTGNAPINDWPEV